ncbi:protein of unknown function (plasmid) [Cupriavidus taiwanensis]|uniref:Uncharacterized protein n=1 Tax=Cupriavidus taiwanensis TaxID=164546 RepID=A0A375HBH0_9BURK|nr:hypothetical protein CBM2614_U10012 [Cupriavidus taiwanensis]SPA11584.1 protein of unknown function [Cupriavidus taiwanensis]SPD49321.1 protein of unknown function [Cupriavidus taiwanensis]
MVSQRHIMVLRWAMFDPHSGAVSSEQSTFRAHHRLSENRIGEIFGAGSRFMCRAVKGSPSA